MSKHTPGPWSLLEINADMACEYQPLELLRKGKHPIRLMNSRDDIADARLIVAAPEMLEALQSLVDSGFNTYMWQETAIKQLIAKATGEA